jgi:ABC-type transport system involved in cytochrome bd biosynthesis fused ATPase/permease subunit
MSLVSALILFAGFSIALLLVPRTGLRKVLAPFRTNALMAYAHALPIWSHPYLDLLKLAEEPSGTYLRLRATMAITALSSAIFIRVLLGQLVPANASLLILVSGIGFMGLIQLERSNVRPNLQRVQNVIHLKIVRPLNRAMAREVAGGKRLRDASLNTTEVLVAAPGKMANLASHQLLPFLGDVVTALIMVALFLVLTGGAYFFVLGIYLIYILAELFLAYSKENTITTDDQKLAQAVLTSFRHYPDDYLSSGLMDVVCRRLLEQKHAQSSRRLEENLNANRESLGGDIANDIVIILMLLILLTQASLSPGQAGQFIAGLLVLFRLTGTIRSAIRRYFRARADAMLSRGLEDHCSRVLRLHGQPGESGSARRAVPTPASSHLSVQINHGMIDLRSQTIPSSRAQLRSIDLDLVGPGCIGITGDSGAGKTTLLRVLAGVYNLQRGEMRLNSRNLRQYSH